MNTFIFQEFVIIKTVWKCALHVSICVDFCIEATHNYKLQCGTASTSRTNNIWLNLLPQSDYLPPLCTYRYAEFDQQKSIYHLIIFPHSAKATKYWLDKTSVKEN